MCYDESSTRPCCRCGNVPATRGEILTEEDDDADEDGDDGAGAQAGRRHRPGGAAVSVPVARTHLDADHGALGERRVPRVGHEHGDVVETRLQVGDLQPQLGVVAWRW